MIDGKVSPWLMLPHSEAWYSADTCEAGEASDIGHPDNQLGTGQMAIDAVTALAEAQPNFPWADYDIEDQGDLDDDGNLFEPDGALDHVIVLHAGNDQAGGGAEGPVRGVVVEQCRRRDDRRLDGPRGRRPAGLQLHHPARECGHRRRSPTSTVTTSACRTCTTRSPAPTPTSAGGT